MKQNALCVCHLLCYVQQKEVPLTKGGYFPKTYYYTTYQNTTLNDSSDAPTVGIIDGTKLKCTEVGWPLMTRISY
jgi:hypothetical protein